MVNFRRNKPFYTETFKLKVVKLIQEGGMSVSKAMTHFQIGGNMTIYNWLSQYAPEWQSRPYKESGNMAKKQSKPAKEKKKEVESSTELIAEIESLKRLLDAERLRSHAYLTMIKLAEEKFNIPIEKKSGAKRSKS